MKNWKKHKLKELFNISSGLSKSRKEFGFGNPFVTFKDVFYNYFLPNELENLANTTDKEIISCSVKKGDIFLTRTSETANELGMSSVALKDYPKATFNGFTKRLRLKENVDIEIDPVFIGYNLRSASVRNQFGMHSSMSTRASLNNDAINTIEIEIPDIGSQIKIGKILKCLDDKIELNRRMNQTLEQMAQALFNHYFVDNIDPDNLPEGWKLENLEQHINIRNGFAFKGNDFSEDGIPVIKIKNVKANKIILDKLSYVPTDVAAKAIKYRIRRNELLITMSGNRLAGTPETWVGKVAIFNRNGEYLLNQRISVIEIRNDKIVSIYYLCQLLSSEEFQYYFASSATSSGGQANISPDLINNTKIIIPPQDKMLLYSDIVKGLYDKIFYNEIEIESLSNIRDLLLPKLMSGEIDVDALVKEEEQRIENLKTA